MKNNVSRRRVLIPFTVLTFSLFVTIAVAQPDALMMGLAEAGRCTSDVPMGAIAPARPIWCEALVGGRDTHTGGGNSWVDEFNHGQSMAELNPAYVEGFIGNGDVLHFQHKDHWMVDIESHGDGALIGAWMRPNRSFQPQSDGSVVIEFEVAVPIAGTREGPTISDSWPELVLSTAPAPPGVQSWGSALRRNGTYLYEAFPHYWTFGCRMQQSRHPICALYMDDDGTAGTKPSRRWEINQNGGEVTSEFGGDPTTPGLADVWKTCTSTQDPDTVCRNKFRWEIRANNVKLFANGVRYYEAGLINTELNNIIRNPNGFYVFFGDFAYRMNPGRALRFHWDRIAVNPGSSGGTPPTPVASPSPSPTANPSPTATAVPPTLTPSNTAVTFDDRSGQNQVLNGQYPNGVIDWGTNRWYHSGPWQKLTTNSVSFNGDGPTSATFNFVTARKLVRLQAYNGASSPTTVFLSCPGQPVRTVSVAADTVVTINTNWTGTCTTVTLAAENGWHTNFDNFVVQ
jgi:hypothetical protein